jgi:hypothetical protein
MIAANNEWTRGKVTLPHHRESRIIAEEKFAESLERGAASSRRQKHVFRLALVGHQFQGRIHEAKKNRYREGHEITRRKPLEIDTFVILRVPSWLMLFFSASNSLNLIR